MNVNMNVLMCVLENKYIYFLYILENIFIFYCKDMS